MKSCTSCGSQLGEQDKFCPSCGTAAAQIEEPAKPEVSASIETGDNVTYRTEKPREKWLGKKPVIIALILLFAGLGSAAAMFMNKSPKDLYLLSEYNSYQDAKEEFDKKYGESIEFQEKMLEKPSRSEVSMSGDLNIDSAEGDPSYDMVKEILSQAEIKLKTEQDPEKNEGYANLALNVDGEKAVDVELLQTKEIMGLKVPLLYEKFFFLNLDEYGDFMRMLDPSYVGPEELNISQLKPKDLELTEKEKKYLEKRYAKFFIKELDEKNFKLKKGVNYEHEGKKMDLREVTLTLSPKETQNLMNSLMNRIIEDDELHSMLIDRVVKIADSASMTTEDLGVDLTDKKEMKKELVNGLKDARKELKKFTYPDGFKSALLIDDKERIIERNAKFGAAYDGEDQINLAFVTKDVPLSSDKRYQEFKLEASPENDKESKGVFQITNDINGKLEDRSEDLEAKMYVDTASGERQEVTFSMKSDFKGKSGSKQEITRDFKVEAAGSEFGDFPSGLTGTIEQTNDTNAKKEYSNQSFKIELNLEDDFNSGSGSVALKVNSKTKLADKISMPKLDSDSSLNVNEITEEQMYEIQQEVSQNIMAVMENLGISPESFYQDSYYEDDYSDEDF